MKTLRQLAESVSEVNISKLYQKSVNEIIDVLNYYNQMGGISNTAYNDLKSAINRKIEQDVETYYSKEFFKIMFPYQQEYRSASTSEEQDAILAKAYGSKEAEDFLDEIRYKSPRVDTIKGYQKACDQWSKAKFKKTTQCENPINGLKTIVSSYTPIASLLDQLKSKIVKGMRVPSNKPIDPTTIENEINFREFLSKLKSVDNEVVSVDVRSLKAKIRINNQVREVKLEEKKLKDVTYYIVDVPCAIQIGNGVKIHYANITLEQRNNEWIFGVQNYTQWRRSPIAIYEWWDNVEKKYRSKV